MEDDYDSEAELDEGERLELHEMSEKIENRESVLDEADEEMIANSTRLRDKHRNRWWSQDVDAYFV
jgi:hypothetical protein